jgi:hypothetical protein
MVDAATTTVVGNTVAALAAAERLAYNGHRVDLYCTGVPGSAFAGIELDGRRVEAGLRLIEREYVAGENALAPPPLHHHVPGHGGHRRWMGMVEDYLCDLLPDLQPASTPQLVLDERRGEDFSLTGRAESIREFFSSEELATVAGQSQAAWGRLGHDAGLLAIPHLYEGATLESASLANHGELFHRKVVEPLAESLIPDGAALVAADQRHKVWAPLFWPSTLHQAAAGHAVDFAPRRRFLTDRLGGMTGVISALMGRLENADHVRIFSPGRLCSIAEGAGTVTMSFDGGVRCEATRPIVGVSPGELFRAVGVEYDPSRVEMSLMWAEVEERHTSEVAATTLLQAGLEAFRVTPSGVSVDGGGQARRRFCVELRHGATPSTDLAARALCAAGAVDDPSVVNGLGARSFDAFAVPTHENRVRYELAHGQMREALPGLMLIGGAAGYGADPLNEQLFGGLRVAMEVCGAHV